MHELGLTAELVKIVDEKAREAGAARVKSVAVTIGAFSGVEAEAVRFCFEVVAQGTLAEGATLEIEKVPLTVRCGSCCLTQVNTENFPACPTCSSMAVEIVAGKEFRIKSMEVD
jgi:hydrogenase nickel incorporation protein HypA/HybF